MSRRSREVAALITASLLLGACGPGTTPVAVSSPTLTTTPPPAATPAPTVSPTIDVGLLRGEIVFTSGRDGGNTDHIWIVNADGSGLRLFSGASTWEHWPVISQIGRAHV